MAADITIRLSHGRKARISRDAWEAIKRSIPIYASDVRVARYSAAPGEGVSTEIVAKIRRTMIANGELPKRAYSRRGEFYGQ